MQAATDLFLGWTTDPASGRQFYVRHLKNRRLGSISELLETKALPQYATLCGRTLARAHARSADAATIWGYMGRNEVFADAIASFAMLYAAQNKKDFAAFVAAGDAAKPASERAASGRDGGAALAQPSPRAPVNARKSAFPFRIAARPSS